MKEITIYPRKLAGTVNIPPSKSLSHRAVICAGLSKGISQIDNLGESEDIDATCKAIKTFGAKISKNASSVAIEGNDCPCPHDPHIGCGESGSTVRFIIPIGAISDEPVTFTGKGRLGERSLEPYFNIFRQQGIEFKTRDGKLPLYLKGKLKPGEFLIPGDISSQFISGLMFVLPLLNKDSFIDIRGSLESKPYVDMTIDVLDKFSINIENHKYSKFYIKGNQEYKATNYTVEGDYSQAAFWFVAGTLGSDICCKGLDKNSLQGDKSIIHILNQMKGNILNWDNDMKAWADETRGITVDASQCPDLVPILAVLASLSQGKTEIINGSRLRLKESDRLTAITTELDKLGADIEERPDGLIIRGVPFLKGGNVDSWNDHRIAMSLAIAAIKCEKPVIINDAQCVNKSYPRFWEDYKGLGGELYERNMG